MVEQAYREGIRTKAGSRITRSSLYRLLANPTYAGLVGHKGAQHPGQHDAIIDDRTWVATTALLDKQRRRAKGTPAKAHGARFGGKVADALGQRLTTTHTISRGKRYDYYAQPQASPGQTALRVPAAALDKLVIDHVTERLGSPAHVVADYPDAPDLGLLIQKAGGIAAALRSESIVTPTIEELVQRVVLATDHVEVILAPEVLGCGVTKAGYRIDSRIGRTKTGLKLVVGGAPEPEVDQGLIRRIALARSWYEELSTGRATIDSIAARYRMTTNCVSGILPLAFIRADDIDSFLSVSLRLRA